MPPTNNPPQLRHELLSTLPLPLAQIYLRAFNSASPVSRHHHAYYLTEAWVRLGVAVGIAALHDELASGGAVSPNLAAALAPLRRPSAGQWVGMIRELARAADGKSGHPWAHVFAQLNQQRSDDDIVEFYRRIKNGIDKDPAGDQSCTLLELLDKLPGYRNDVIGHGGQRPDTFYVEEMEAILVAAVQQAFGPEHCGILGPSGSKLVIIGEVKTIDDGFVDIQVFELTGPTAVRRSKPLRLAKTLAEKLRPGHVAVEWPGRPEPVSLSPILIGAIDDGAVTIRILNSTTKSKVEYLDFMSGSLSQEASEFPALNALLSRIVAGPIPAMPDHPATMEYELLGVLGQGGMGVVHLARQRPLGRLVAVKLLPKELSGDTSFERRLRNEFRALSRCEHPNIIQIYAGGQWHDGSPFYSMEFVPGCNLERIRGELSGSAAVDPDANTWDSAVRSATTKLFGEIAKKNRPKEATAAPPMPLPPIPEALIADRPKDYVRRIAVLFRDAARALHVVHEHNIKHRDIKPANLMLTADGSRIVLMDFGLAQGDDLSRSISGDGFLGTLRYAAPEQLVVTTREFDPATDVRALAVTFWELFTRRRIFSEAKDERQLPEMVVHREVPSLRSIDKRFDRDIDAIMSRATEIRLTDRTKSAKLLADQLDLYLERKELPIRPIGAVERTGRWLRNNAAAASITALIVLLLGLSLWGWLRQQPPGLQQSGADPNIQLRAERERLLANQGMTLIRANNETKALPWLAAALEQTDDPNRRDMTSRRIHGIFAQSVFPNARWKHDAPITVSAFCYDGSLVLTAGFDKTVRVVETSTGRELARHTFDAGVRAAAFHRNKTVVAVATADRQVHLWNLQTNKLEGDALVHPSAVLCVAFSPDGSSLAAGGGTSFSQKTVTVTKMVHEQRTRPDGSTEVIQKPVSVEETRMEYDDDLTPQEKPSKPDRIGFVRIWSIPARNQRDELITGCKVNRVLFSRESSHVIAACFDSMTMPAAVPAPAAELPRAPADAREPIATLELAADDNAPGPPVPQGPSPTAETQPSKPKSMAAIQVLDLRGPKSIWSAVGTDLQGTVQYIGFSADGFLEAIVADKSMIYDLASGQFIAKPFVHEKLGKTAAMSSGAIRINNGYTLATITDRDVAIWKTDPWRGPHNMPRATDQPAEQLLEFSGSVIRRLPMSDAESLAFDLLGTMIVTGGKDGAIRTWDTLNGRPIFPAMQLESPIKQLVISPDDRYVLAVTGDQRATLYDLARGMSVPEKLPLPKSPVVRRAILSRNGDLIAVTTSDNSQDVVLWNRRAGASVSRIRPGADSAVRAFWLDSNGQSLLALNDRRMSCWDVATKARRSVVDIADEYQTLHSCADGKRFWIEKSSRPANAPPAGALSGESRTPNRTPDGDSTCLRGWNLATGQRLPDLIMPGGPPLGFFPSKDGHYVAAIGDSKKVWVWDADTGRQLAESPISTGQGITTLAFSPDARQLAIAFDDKSFGIWNLDAKPGTPLKQAHSETPITLMRYSPDGTRLATAGAETTSAESPSPTPRAFVSEIRIWNVETGSTVGRPIRKPLFDTHSIQFSDDGQALMIFGQIKIESAGGFEIQVFEMATGDPLSMPLAANALAAKPELAPNGRSIHVLNGWGELTTHDVGPCQQPPEDIGRTARMLAAESVDPAGVQARLTSQGLDQAIQAEAAGPARITIPEETAFWRSTLRDAQQLFDWNLAALAAARLIKQHPEVPGNWEQAANALAELGRWQEAADAYSKASELEPNDARQVHNQILCLLRAEKLTEARTVCSRALGRLSDYDDPVMILAAAALIPNAVADWAPHLKRLDEICKRTADCNPWHTIALTSFRAGLLDKGFSSVLEAKRRCQRRDGNPQDRLVAALIRARQQRLDEAAGLYLGAIQQISRDRMDPFRSPELRLHWSFRAIFDLLRRELDVLKLPKAKEPIEIHEKKA